jgi:protein-disulfide isomerase
LQQQEKAPDGWQQLGITIGNSSATNHIIKVCNPYCGPCAKAHEVLEELLHQKNVKVTILFNATNNENDIKALPTRHLLAIAALGDNTKTRQALDHWYLSERKDYELFANRYPMNGELNEQIEKIKKMQEWCSRAAITHTPTIFLNGHRLPENYTLEEIKDILPCAS